jgi:hypothetical protein
MTDRYGCAIKCQCWSSVTKFVVVPTLGGFGEIHMDAVRMEDGVLSSFSIGPLPLDVCEQQVSAWVDAGYGERGYIA